MGVLAGEREVVHGRQDRERVVDAQPVDEVEHLLLVADVERAGGLVEQQDRRGLGQRPGDHHPLALAARQRAERPVERTRRGRAARAPASPPRGRAGPPTPAGRGAGCARAARSRPRSCRPAPPAPAGTSATSRARSRRRSSADRRGRRSRPGLRRPPDPATTRSSVVLPLPFGPTTLTQSPGSTVRSRWSRIDRPPSRTVTSLATMPTLTPPSPRLRRSTTMKNGAPKNAVTTPIGSSAGDERGAGDQVGEGEERGAEQDRQREHDAVAVPGRPGGPCGAR